MSTRTMPALPSSDLRSEAKAYRRDKNQTTKWSRGGRGAPGKSCGHEFTQSTTTCNDCVARPNHRDGARDFSKRYFQRIERSQVGAQGLRHGGIAKKVLQNDLGEVTANSDSGSSDEEVAAISEAPVPETEIMYSYDAKSGPSAGTDVLSHAVMQAVKRYENKQTERLVRNEYDLVLDGKEDDYAGDAEDDDFEIIDVKHLS